MTKLEMEAKLRDIRAHTLLALVENIDTWGVDRNITREGGATALAQVAKMVGELEETLTTLNSMLRLEMQELAEPKEATEISAELDVLKDQLEDDYGDMIVCIIQAMRLSGTDIISCLQGAWNDIKDRKGKMIDGKFIKESDLPSYQLDEEALPELDETEKEVLAQINEAMDADEREALIQSKFAVTNVGYNWTAYTCVDCHATITIDDRIESTHNNLDNHVCFSGEDCTNGDCE